MYKILYTISTTLNLYIQMMTGFDALIGKVNLISEKFVLKKTSKKSILNYQRFILMTKVVIK